MTDRSRREILRGASVVGLLGLGSGAGTYAMLNDGEELLHSATTGTLDLQTAAAIGDGAPSNFDHSSDVVLSFPEFSPQEPASGRATIALRSCSNPAWGSLQTVTVTESPLADHIVAVLTYVRHCGNADSESAVLYDGPLAGLEDAVGDGLPLSAVDCTPLGKLEFDEDAGTLSTEDGESVHVDDLPYTFEFDAGSLTVTGVNTDDGKIIGVNVTTDDVDLCAAHVKGGGTQDGSGGGGSTGDGFVHYHLGCARDATDLNAGTTPSGTQSGLSHVSFDSCDGERHCLTCETSACVTLDWQYEPPKSKKTLESLENEAFELVIEFGARQCRHSSEEEP